MIGWGLRLQNSHKHLSLSFFTIDVFTLSSVLPPYEMVGGGALKCLVVCDYCRQRWTHPMLCSGAVCVVASVVSCGYFVFSTVSSCDV